MGVPGRDGREFLWMTWMVTCLLRERLVAMRSRKLLIRYDAVFVLRTYHKMGSERRGQCLFLCKVATKAVPNTRPRCEMLCEAIQYLFSCTVRLPKHTSKIDVVFGATINAASTGIPDRGVS